MASSAESLVSHDDSHMCPMQHIEAVMLGSVWPHLEDIKVNQFSKAGCIIFVQPAQFQQTMIIHN